MNLICGLAAAINQRLKITDQPGQIQLLDRLTERAEPDLLKERVVLLGVSYRHGWPPHTQRGYDVMKPRRHDQVSFNYLMHQFL
jgi:hypothetical protein